MDEDGSGDLSRIDSECCRLVLPFLRVASLVRHYVFQQDLPEISEEATEFAKLARFLELIHVDRKTSRDDNDMDDSTISTPLSTIRHDESSISGLHWFTGDASEFLLWLESLRAAVCPPNLTLVRKALRISLIWKQPKLLRLPKNYDQIFQVCWNENTILYFIGLKSCLPYSSLSTISLIDFFLFTVLSQAQVLQLPARSEGPDRLSDVWYHGLSQGTMLQTNSWTFR